MPATDFSSSTFNRSILGVRRDHDPTVSPVHNHSSSSSMASGSPIVDNFEADLDVFQRSIFDRFTNLPEPVLSLEWLLSLLDAFLCCHEEFRIILAKSRYMAQKPPLDRHVQDFFDRSVKALDVCNAIRDGINQIREWKKLLSIVLSALDHRGRPIGEGHFRRAKKALIELSILLLEEKDNTSSSSSTILSHRNRSFGRHTSSSAAKTIPSRSLSWSVSRSWSAARQLQALGSNLVAPKMSEVAATGGVASAVYAMGSIMLLVMWSLVAAIPCQDRGLNVHISVPRGLTWSGAVVGIHESLLEESRKRERRNACGLLREIYDIERSVRVMGELVDSVQFPLGEEKEDEVKERVSDLKRVCEWLNEGLDSLESQVRDVFNRIVVSRSEGLDSGG